MNSKKLEPAGPSAKKSIEASQTTFQAHKRVREHKQRHQELAQKLVASLNRVVQLENTKKR